MLVVKCIDRDCDVFVRTSRPTPSKTLCPRCTARRRDRVRNRPENTSEPIRYTDPKVDPS
jgi:hypothetical protein